MWKKVRAFFGDNDKPAVVWDDGVMEWHHRGKLHRDHDKPAMTFEDGTKYWCKHGKNHRMNGPAVFDARTGKYEWWIEGVRYATEEEYLEARDKILFPGRLTKRARDA